MKTVYICLKRKLDSIQRKINFGLNSLNVFKIPNLLYQLGQVLSPVVKQKLNILFQICTKSEDLSIVPIGLNCIKITNNFVTS